METVMQSNTGAMHRSPHARAGLASGATTTPGPDWRRIVAGWIERRRQRRALARLDARLLADVGITPDEAAREIATPFWR